MLRHDLLPEAAWEMSLSLQGGVWPPAASLAVVGALPGMARTSIPSPWPFLSFSLPSACHHHPRTSALWLPQAFRPCFLHFLILAAHPSSPTSSAGMPRDASRTWTPCTWESSAFPSTAAGRWPLPKFLSASAVPLPRPMPARSPLKDWCLPAASGLYLLPPACFRRFSRHLRGPDGDGLNSLQASDPCGWHKAAGHRARRLPSPREPEPAPAVQPPPKPTDLSFLS